MPTLAALAAAFALAQADPAALPDSTTVEALLDRRELALGTSAARAAGKGLVSTGHFEMPGVSGTVEALYSIPAQPGERERVLVTIRMEGWGETTQGTDGVVSWSTDPGFGVMVREGVEAGGIRRSWAVQRSAPWRSLYSAARALRHVERDGRALLELAMTPLDGGKEERWLVDPETTELVRFAVEYPGPTGEVLPMGIVLSDWKRVDGVLYPHRITQEVMGGVPGTPGGEGAPIMSIVIVRDSVRHEAIPDARIAPPEDVRAAMADASRQAPRPSADPLACSLETTKAQPVATVRLECEATKVSQTLAVVLGEVGRAVTEQGGAFAGPPFSRYHSIADGKIDLEAGIAVKAPIEARGRVKPSELPGGKAAMTWHVGSYHELQKSYDRLSAWMEAQHLAPRGGFWEIYWTDPGLEPDPSTWKTQIFWPVAE